MRNDIARLKIICVLVFIFMCLELFGHIYSHSLSLFSEFIHLSIDFLSFILNILALYLGTKKPSKKFTHGYHKIEAFGALLSIAIIWVGIVYLCSDIYQRLINPIPIKGNIFLMISSLGIVLNIISLTLLHNKCTKSQNLNIRAAYIHIASDLFQSIIIFLSSVAIFFNAKFLILDTICTIIFSFVVSISSLNIFKDAVFILIDRLPNDINYDKIHEDVNSLDDIEKIVSLKIWALSVSIYSVIIEIKVKNEKINKYHQIKMDIENILKKYPKVKYIWLDLQDNDSQLQN